MRRDRQLQGMAAAAALVLLGVVPARALPKLQGIGETSVGYTDNARTSPDSAASGAEQRSKSGFLVLSPGVVLALESERSLQRFGYRYEYDLFFSESSASGSSNRLDYRGFFELSRSVTLVLGAAATESNRYTAVALAPPGAGVVSALPPGAGAFLQAEVEQTLSFELGVAWRAWLGTNAVVEAPILGTEGPQTTAVGARTGLERSFLVDAVGVEARAHYARIADGVRSDGSPAGVVRQLVSGGVATWRRDWGRYLTSRLELGALRVQRFEPRRGFWAPTGAATLAYANDFGDAQLGWSHHVTTNAVLGQSLLVDEFQLRAALPLGPEGDFVLAAATGYQRGSLIDEAATLGARIEVILVDVSLGWRANSALELGVRYQHIEQRTDALAPPLPVGFVQNNVLLGATLRFPAEKDMPRPYRAPRRVDRSDEIREGQPLLEGPRTPQQAPP